MKRFISILVTIAMLVSLLASMTFSISAESYEGTWGDLTWTLDSKTGELIISGEGEMDKLSSFSNNAWRTHSNLITTVTINDGITSIANNAFYECYNLKSIYIPDSVTSIGNYSFYTCFALTSINITKGIESIGEEALYGCKNLTNITVDENNTYYKSIDGNLYSKDAKTLILYATGKSENSFNIPAGVKIIGDYAFSACNNLTSIIIPDSVTDIKYRAFQSCRSLKSINIPESVLNVDADAFFGCSGLKSVTISKNQSWIYSGTFYNCTALKTVNIPNSIKNITWGAFEGCSTLSNVNYYGIENDWNDVIIDSNNDYLLKARVNYFYGSKTFDSASVRISSEYPGLRFKTAVTQDVLDELAGIYGKENLRIGTIIVPADTVTTLDVVTVAALDEANIKYMNIPANIDLPFSSDGTTNIYAGSLVNIKEANLDRDFIGIGYIAATKNNGDVIYYYSSSSATRNVSYIASCAIEDTNETQENEYKYEISVGETICYSPYTETQREILDKLIVKK